jgi:quinol monooxygenase YgiN|tara:strand:+ start:137 stop:544 length:408 start_codon:yes stop_codon:yes gene_type:complete
MPTNLTPTLPQNDPEHWYVHVVFDVANSDAFANYLNEQVKIEQQNGMTSYEYFVDNVDQPTQAILIECFPNDAAQKNHLINHRPELFLAGLANPRITVLGNPPPATRDRMLKYGFWPPAFEGDFNHFATFGGFRT